MHKETNMLGLHKTRSVRLTLIFSLALIVPLLLSSCGGSSAPAQEGVHLNMAPMAEMPPEVQSAPVTVQQAYQFAVANPDVLQQIACYCGCGPIGHTSNYACYVSGENADGSPVFDGHALGCSICVDITQDAMRFVKEGKSVPEIFQIVDQTYSQYGPSNLQ